MTQRRRYSDDAIPPDTERERQVLLEQSADYIGTLIPSKLTETDYIDLSWRSDVNLCTQNIPRHYGILPTHHLRYTMTSRWPPRSGGFLYMHKPADSAPGTAVGLRFRVTNNADPANFAGGEDLILRGLPWTTPLIYSNMQLFNYIIRRDGILPHGVVDRLWRLNAYIKSRDEGGYTRWEDPYTPLLYSRSQPFAFDFSRVKVRFWLLKAGNLKKSEPDRLQQMWFPSPALSWSVLTEPERRELEQKGYELRGQYFPLYRGSAIARFEWLKSPQQKDVKRLAVRILKVVNPVVPNEIVGMDLPELKEGSYVPIMDPRNRKIDTAQGPFPPGHPEHLLSSLPNLHSSINVAA